MATATYIQRGEALDYTNSGTATIAAGTVISIGARVGVAGCDIEPGAVGSLHVMGVFKVAKTGAAAIDMGADVYFDGTGITGTSGTGTVKAGYAAAAAEASDTTIEVSINA